MALRGFPGLVRVGQEGRRNGSSPRPSDSSLVQNITLLYKFITAPPSCRETEREETVY